MTERGVAVAASIPSRGFAVQVTLPADAVTAIVGPNGSGKSTLLHLVCGVLRPEAGSVVIDGQVVSATGSDAATPRDDARPDGRPISDAATPRDDARAGRRSAHHVPPHRRTVALLDQRPLLFPHLDVLANVAFGVRARGASARTAHDRARGELEAVGAAALATRRPATLSGGQAQRVALARALATDPTVVLLDEPFASLDVVTAAALRHLLAGRLRASGATIVIATHDPLDVWALADRIVCIEDGSVAADGTVLEHLGRPSTRFLAQFSGANLLSGTVEEDVLRVGEDQVAGLWDPARTRPPGHRALATFVPAAVALFRDHPHGSPRNTWAVRVTGLDPRGPVIRVHLRLTDGQLLAADLTASAVVALDVRPGQELLASVKAAQVALYGRD